MREPLECRPRVILDFNPANACHHALIAFCRIDLSVDRQSLRQANPKRRDGHSFRQRELAVALFGAAVLASRSVTITHGAFPLSLSLSSPPPVSGALVATQYDSSHVLRPYCLPETCRDNKIDCALLVLCSDQRTAARRSSRWLRWTAA